MVETTENRVKIGAKVNESVYAEFKEFVYEKTGQKRGVLGEAVEAALVEYMDDSSATVSGDVSNEDLLREIRALQHSDETPAPSPRSGESESDEKSVESDGGASESRPSSDENTPAPSPRSGKGTLEDDSTDDDGSDDKPPLNAPPGERVDWLASSINIEGPVPFDTLVNVVGEEYPKLSESKCRDLAWGFAAAAKPDRGDYPDELDRNLSDAVAPDSELRTRVNEEDRPELHFYPRSHATGAWFKVENKYSEALLNHQEPTERGEIVVYLGESGAVTLAKEYGWLPSDYDEDPEEEEGPLSKWDNRDKSNLPAFMRDDEGSTDSESKEESTDSESKEESTDSESKEDVDMPGSKDSDSTFEEIANADRERDY